MRLYSVRLVAAVSLFACVEASALELQPEPTLPETSGHGHTSDQTFPQNGAITVDEERMPRLNVIEAARAIAIKLQKSQFADWALKCEKKLGLTSLKPLNPELKSDDLFRNPPSDAWDEYAKVKVNYSSRKRLKYKMLLRVLLARYDEFDLAKAFHAAMKISKLKTTAEHLQLQLNLHWDATKPPYEELFVKLGLDPTKDGFLGSPLFRTWYHRVQESGYPRDSAVVKILKDRLGNFGLVKMLHAAEKVKETKVVASSLQKARFADWALKCEKELGLTSLKPLNPELKSDDLFRNPPSDAWDKLVDAGDLVNIEHKMLLRMLLARYNEFDLAKAFHAAMEIDELKSTAECLQLQLYWRWEATKPPYEELFVELGLDPTNEDFIGSHLFRTWYDVVAVEVLRCDSTVVEFLKAHLDDFGLAKALEAAKKVDSAEHIVDNLENAFIYEWGYDHPHEVFDRLGLKATSDDLLGIPLFKLWYKFAMQNQWSTEEVVKILLTRSDNFSFAKMLDGAKKVDSTSALAIELEKAYIRVWKGKHPDRLFDELGLKATSDDLLGIPLFKTWYNFATQKWSTLDVVKFLESRSDDFSVAKMLEGATKAEDTKKIAFELQAAQFGH